jgi:hypothetical protein
MEVLQKHHIITILEVIIPTQSHSSSPPMRVPIENPKLFKMRFQRGVVGAL